MAHSDEIMDDHFKGLIRSLGSKRAPSIYGEAAHENVGTGGGKLAQVALLLVCEPQRESVFSFHLLCIL
jgi:hypothetical protein